MEKHVAILMVDLAGYTAMTDVHGGESAAKIVNKYMELVDNSLYGDSEVVQRIGDQVVLISESPADLVVTAYNLKNCALTQHHFLSIHAGIHFGPIHRDAGSLFGSTINITSRIMNIARRGQILCSAKVVDEMPLDFPFSFNKIGKVKLRNVLNEVEIFELNVKEEFSNEFHFDPVCHMLMNPNMENHTYTFEENSYYFCSMHCMELFKTNPEMFLQQPD